MPLGASKEHKIGLEAKKFADDLATKNKKQEQEKHRDFLLQVKKHPMPIVIGKRQSIVSYNVQEGFILTTESESLKLKDDAAFWKMIKENEDLSKTK